MNNSLTEFIAVVALLGLLGLGIVSYQQSQEIASLKKLNEQKSLRIETMEKTLLMSR